MVCLNEFDCLTTCVGLEIEELTLQTTPHAEVSFCLKGELVLLSGESPPAATVRPKPDT